MDSRLQQARFERLTKQMNARGLEAVALVPGANFYFLTGVTLGLMERPTVLLITNDGQKHAIMPSLEKELWRSAAPDFETVYWQDSDGYDAAFQEVARRMKIATIGVEGQRMRFFEALALREAFPDVVVSDGQQDIAAMRLSKDAAELSAIQTAIEISEKALAETIAWVSPGMSETEIRRKLVASMLDNGADGSAFDPIVLAGAASAQPHGVPSADRRLAIGDALLFDWGASWGGYSADITRTFFCREVSDERSAVYHAVAEANALGRSVARPGLTLDELDRTVTKALRGSGFGDLVVHKTGHGLGLDIHEAPQVMVGNMQELQPGMVITIEPGLYRAGDVGVRIEDDVVITDDGCRSLTRYDRSLTLIG